MLCYNFHAIPAKVKCFTQYSEIMFMLTLITRSFIDCTVPKDYKSPPETATAGNTKARNTATWTARTINIK